MTNDNKMKVLSIISGSFDKGDFDCFQKNVAKEMLDNGLMQEWDFAVSVVNQMKIGA